MKYRKFRADGKLNEFTTSINGWSFHIIYGKQINGWFICIPDWKVGVEATNYNDVLWNEQQLLACGNETVKTNAKDIALTIKKFMEAES